MNKYLGRYLARLLLAFDRGLRTDSSILMYHSIGENGSFLTVRASELEKQLAYLHAHNGRTFSVVPLSYICRALSAPVHGAPVHEGKAATATGLVALTFDDAYEDFYTLAWPLLKRYKLPATLFVPTGLLGTSWTLSDGTRLPLMTAAMLKEIAGDGLVECLPHTQTHANLSIISPKSYAAEIDGSRRALEEICGSGKARNILAYPWGRSNQAVMAYLRDAGWLAAVGISFGLVSQASDPFMLPRNRVGPETSFDLFRLFVSDRLKFFLAIMGR